MYILIIKFVLKETYKIYNNIKLNFGRSDGPDSCVKVFENFY